MAVYLMNLAVLMVTAIVIAATTLVSAADPFDLSAALPERILSAMRPDRTSSTGSDDPDRNPEEEQVL